MTDYSQHVSTFIHAFTKDCSIRVICAQITEGVCFIRVVATAYVVSALIGY